MVTGLWSGLKPYPRMKRSDLPWAGDVPEHWTLMPNRGMLKKRKILVGDRHNEYQLLSLTKLGVIVRDISTGRGKFSADMGTSQIVCNGDLVFCLFDVPETPRTVGLSTHDGMITSAYTVFECHNNLLARFLELFYIAMDDRKLLSPLYSGLRHTISPSKFLGIKTPIPPIAEQEAIVKYLDYGDRRIRKLIQAKRKLIGLLNEQKQAIIHQAVTRGLDPDVPLKDSGIEWLGQIPKHWNVVPLKYLGDKFGSGITPRGGGAVYQTEGVPFLRSQNVHFTGLKLNNVAKISFELHNSLSSTHLKPYDVLLNITGASLGRVCIVPHDFYEGNVNQHVCIIRAKQQQLNPNYLSAYLSTPGMQKEIQIEQNGASREGLSLDSIRNFNILLPPIHEQQKVVEYLEQATAEIDQAIDRANREIELLNEYRTRLIADVVTGKLDVRDIAATLPDHDPLAEADLNDPLEEETDLESPEDIEEED